MPQSGKPKAFVSNIPWPRGKSLSSIRFQRRCRIQFWVLLWYTQTCHSQCQSFHSKLKLREWGQSIQGCWWWPHLITPLSYLHVNCLVFKFYLTSPEKVGVKVLSSAWPRTSRADQRRLELGNLLDIVLPVYSLSWHELDKLDEKHGLLNICVLSSKLYFWNQVLLLSCLMVALHYRVAEQTIAILVWQL